MELIVTFIASLLCGTLGRMGGAKGYDTKFRDLGIPLIATLLLLFLGFRNPIALLVSFGLLFASLTTYWDFLFGEDNFFFHAFMCGLSFLPVAYTMNHWFGLLGSVTLITLWMGLWSKLTSWDVLEEFGRYFIIPFGIYILTR